MEAYLDNSATTRCSKAAADKMVLLLTEDFVLFSIGLNLYRMSNAVSYHSNPSSAVERQEQQLHFNRHHAPSKRDNKETDKPTNETEACSTCVVIMCLPALWFAMALPIMARLLDSVAPDV